jgi:hypothetical protein
MRKDASALRRRRNVRRLASAAVVTALAFATGAASVLWRSAP